MASGRWLHSSAFFSLQRQVKSKFQLKYMIVKGEMHLADLHQKRKEYIVDDCIRKQLGMALSSMLGMTILFSTCLDSMV